MRCDEDMSKGRAECRGGQIEESEGSRGLGPCSQLESCSVVMGVHKCAYALQEPRKTGFTEGLSS